ncbi:MAG: amidohydrolase family protein [Acidobacteriota bacterium]|nr:amidohydrolase family protein [Acidobacteriota bacterium]
MKKYLFFPLFPGLLVIGLWFVTNSSVNGQDLPPEVIRYADMIMHTGQVLTMDHDMPPFLVTEAIAIRDGRIMAVGKDNRILRMAGPDTKKVDLAGKTVLPGFVDSHSHPNSYALSHHAREYTATYIKFLREHNIRFIVVNWETKETVLSDFQKAAAGLPEGHWIYSTVRSSAVQKKLTRWDLDQVVPDNPIYVRVGNAIYGMLNSKMLEIVDELYGGRVPGLIKDENGVPTGQIYGPLGETLDEELMPQVPPDLLGPILKKELDEWIALGITTLSSRFNGGEITAYAQLDRNGQLPLRLAYTHEVGRRNVFLERDLKRFGGIQGHGTDRMWLIGISIGNPDGDPPGSPGGGGNCTTIPKLIMLPNDLYPNGNCFWDDVPGDTSREAPAIVNRFNYRVAGVHNLGDKASLEHLAAYEKADQEKSIAGKRFALDHGMMVSPDVIKRTAELDAVWSLQPIQLYNNAPTFSRVYGEEVAQRWMHPVKSMIDAGIRVAWGADTHSDPERHPLFGLQVLVTRKAKDGRVFGPREKLDRATALLMMTRWSAEYVLREEDLGSLESGKLADLVILDKNPLDPTVPDESLSQIQVLAAIVGGELEYGSLSWTQ